MNRIRLRLTILIIWVLSTFYVGLWTAPAYSTRPTSLWGPAAAIIVLLAAPLRQLKWWLVLGLWAVPFLGLKLAFAGQAGGTNLAVSIVEGVAQAGMVLLARWVGAAVSEFELAVTRMAIGPQGERRARQAEIYREIQRARVHQRPLALLSLRPVDRPSGLVVDRIVQEAQQAVLRHYVLAGVSRAVCEVVDEYHIVAKHKDQFLVVLPEATPDTAAEVAKNLRRAVFDQVGVHVQLGMAVMPQDATTFDALADKAIGAMTAEDEPAAAPARPPVGLAFGQAAQEATHGHVDRQ
jgi:GGDEF domain-containing protein